MLDELAGRTTLAPFAVSWSGASSGAAVSCDARDGMRYSGEFSRLTLLQCTHVSIEHARIGALRVLDSDVKLVDSQVLDGIYALRSQVELSAGVVSGTPALKLDASEVDAAGTRFESEGAIAENLGRAPRSLRLSVAEVRRAGKAPRYVHDFVNLEPEGRW